MIETEQYRPLVEKAVEAFRTDPQYATDMAKQAGILSSRAAARAATLDGDPSDD